MPVPIQTPEDVVDVARDPGDPLAEQPDVDVVAERDGHLEPGVELAAQVDTVDPVLEVRDGQHLTVVDHAGHACADRRGRSPSDRISSTIAVTTASGPAVGVSRLARSTTL